MLNTTISCFRYWPIYHFLWEVFSDPKVVGRWLSFIWSTVHHFMRGLSEMRRKASMLSCLMCSLLEDKGEARLKGIWLFVGTSAEQREWERQTLRWRERCEARAPASFTCSPTEWWISQFTYWVLQKYVFSTMWMFSKRPHTKHNRT